VISVIERFCDTLIPKEGWGRKWNASDMCTYLGFDIMGALVFGCEMKTVQEVGNRDLAESVLPASMLMYWVRRYSSLLMTGVMLMCVIGFVPPSGVACASAPAHQAFRDDWWEGGER
jgi:hypothetical protein